MKITVEKIVTRASAMSRTVAIDRPDPFAADACPRADAGPACAIRASAWRCVSFSSDGRRNLGQRQQTEGPSRIPAGSGQPPQIFRREILK